MTPVALINRVVDGCPAVLIPTADGMNQAVDHLYALGHRQIVYLAGSQSYSNTTRLDGFTAACTRLDLECKEIDLDDSRFSAGVRAGDLVIASGATAVIAYNDEIAVGVMNRLAYRGVRVPADVSVIGFDDTGLAEMAMPLLTSVRLPAEHGRGGGRAHAPGPRGRAGSPRCRAAALPPDRARHPVHDGAPTGGSREPGVTGVGRDGRVGVSSVTSAQLP